MTKGNPKVIVRLTPALRSQILAAIERRNSRTREEPWDISAFIRNAIRDKLHHMERSRRRRKKGTENGATASPAGKAGAA